MIVNPAVRVSTGPSQPAPPAPAPVPGGTAAPAPPGQPQPVQPVATPAAAARGREAGLSDRPAEVPAADEPEETTTESTPVASGDTHGPVLALMRQAAALCRIANSRQFGDGPDEPPGALSLGMAQSQDDLSVRGNLVVAGEQGFRVGSGQIYRSGELVAAFSGTSVAFIGGSRVSTRL